MDVAIVLTLVFFCLFGTLYFIQYSVKQIGVPHIESLTEQIERIGGRDIWIQRDYNSSSGNAFWFDVVFTDTTGKRLPNRVAVYKDAYGTAISDYIWLTPLKMNDIESVRNRLNVREQSADSQFVM